MLRAGLLCILAAVVLCGCAQPLLKTDPPPTSGETYYVFGLKPSNYKVQIFPGSVGSDGVFKLNLWLNGTFNGSADQGYAVGKAKAGTALAITRVYIDASAHFDPPFVPCGDSETIVFTGAGGKVIYLGDVEYRFTGNNVMVSRKSDIEGARTYLSANFPQLAPLLQEGDSHLAKTDIPCTNKLYIPIYLPSR